MLISKNKIKLVKDVKFFNGVIVIGFGFIRGYVVMRIFL